MNYSVQIMILAVILSVWCPFAKAMGQDQKPLVEYVQDLNKAKDILRPESKLLMIVHDPFDPIIVVPSYQPVAATLNKPPAAAAAVKAGDPLGVVRVIGIVRLEREYRAYVTIGAKARVVNVGDKILAYTITGIDMDQLVFEFGDKKIVKKRGIL